MLSQFSVSNFRSIKDTMTLDMQAASIAEHEEQIIHAENNEVFLPVSVIYGPNGGGKSNVLRALYALIDKVIRPINVINHKSDIPTEVDLSIKPFAFSSETRNQPTEFELFFRTALAEYRYLLVIQNEKVLYEKLDRKKHATNRQSALFEREAERVVMKSDIKRLKVTDALTEELPLLSFLGITYRKNEIINDIIDWFQHKIAFLNYGNPWIEFCLRIDECEQYKHMILNMLKEMDIDIEDFRIEKKENGEPRVFTIHQVDSYQAELNLREESSGTQKIFNVLPVVVDSLFQGKTLVVDELDAKIHPSLLKYIIELFNNPAANKKGAQLIFTSHDLTTMNNALFRRDEIWFVAKGNQQNSQLYSLVEFKTDNGRTVRPDAQYFKQYLEGKYGADPYLRRIIEWENENGQR